MFDFLFYLRLINSLRGPCFSLVTPRSWGGILESSVFALSGKGARGGGKGRGQGQGAGGRHSRY